MLRERAGPRPQPRPAAGLCRQGTSTSPGQPGKKHISRSHPHPPRTLAGLAGARDCAFILTSPINPHPRYVCRRRCHSPSQSQQVTANLRTGGGQGAKYLPVLSLSPGERNPRLGCPGVCQCGKGTAGGNPHPCQGAPSLKLWGAGGSPVDQEEPRPASCGCWFQIHPGPGREGGVLGQGPGGADAGPRGGSA